MRTYLISYDLANPNAKKHAIANVIMGFGARWARPLEQTWYVTTPSNAEEIEEQLSWMLGDEDGLLVQAVANEAVLTNTSLRWFKQRGAEAKAVATSDGSNVVPFASHDDGLPEDAIAA